jgi:hypothetical protein
MAFGGLKPTLSRSKIVGRQTRVLRDAREHARPDFFGIMEWENVVGEAGTTQHAM